MYYLLLFIISLNLVYSQQYCAGDQISFSDQNAIHVVGAGIEGYEVGSEFSVMVIFSPIISASHALGSSANMILYSPGFDVVIE